MDDEIEPDFYIAVPEIMSELNPLKKKLKKRFPKLNRSKGEFFFIILICYEQLYNLYILLENKIANIYAE